MREISKFLAIGGDERQIYMAKSLVKHGYKVEVYGLGAQESFDGLEKQHNNLSTAVKSASAIILPLPVSKDGITINSSYAGNIETLAELSEMLERGQIVFAGMMSNSWKSNFFKRGIQVYDYFEREELAVNNAIPTAQGVIKIAIDNIKITIHGSKCAITGFGRTARVLARMLYAMGAQVIIAARKCSDLAWAKAEGYEGVYLKDLFLLANDIDILVNTVPTLVVDEQILKNLNRECVVIEIASSPFGIDFAAANDLGLKVINSGSLPGKTAPKTAGEIISDAIINIIKEGSE